MISSLITGITLRDDTQNAARPDTLQWTSQSGLLGAVWDMVIKV